MIHLFYPAPDPVEETFQMELDLLKETIEMGILCGLDLMICPTGEEYEALLEALPGTYKKVQLWQLAGDDHNQMIAALEETVRETFLDQKTFDYAKICTLIPAELCTKLEGLIRVTGKFLT